jgi:hypothetical protein
MIKLSGSIARKRKKRRKKTRSRCASYLPKSAESGFRSFETGDYSNEIRDMARIGRFGSFALGDGGCVVGVPVLLAAVAVVCLMYFLALLAAMHG